MDRIHISFNLRTFISIAHLFERAAPHQCEDGRLNQPFGGAAWTPGSFGPAIITNFDSPNTSIAKRTRSEFFLWHYILDAIRRPSDDYETANLISNDTLATYLLQY